MAIYNTLGKTSQKAAPEVLEEKIENPENQSPPLQ